MRRDRTLFFLLYILSIASPILGQVASQETCQLTDSCTIVFASQEQGRAAIGKQDEFMKRTQTLERQIRLSSKDPVSVEEYTQFLQDGVREWKESEI